MSATSGAIGRALHGTGDKMGSALMKYLAKAQAMGETGMHVGGALGKAGLEAAPGLIRDNPRLAAAAIGGAGVLGGVGGDELAHMGDHEDEEERKQAEMHALLGV